MNDSLLLPSIIVEDATGTHPISMLSYQLNKDRRIYITDTITDELATSVISQLLYLAKEPDKPIDILICSPGGSVMAGMAIYDTVQALAGKVTVNMYGYGMCASMAAVLLCSGFEGHRFLSPNGKMLLHEPLLSSGVSGSCSNITQTAEKILETKHQLCNIIAKHCKKEPSEIEELVAGGIDIIKNSSEALEFGLIDSIATPLE